MNANAVKDLHYEQWPRIHYITNALKNLQITMKFSGSCYNFYIIDTDILLLQNSFLRAIEMLSKA